MPNKRADSLDIPIFQYVNETMQVNFSISRDEIGASELGYGQKKIVIEHTYEIKKPSDMRMLAGKIGHSLIEYKPIRTKIVKAINDQLGIKGEPKSIVQKAVHLEILPGKTLRLHPDILTPYYPIEEKWTAQPVRKWTRDAAPYYVNQLNMYSGFYKMELGILLVVNLNVFLSASKDFKYIMNNYIFILPFEHNNDQYRESLALTEKLFNHIDNEDFESLPCPIHSWECTWCLKEVREICGKERYTCQFYDPTKGKKHGKAMFEYPKELTGKFTDTPLCEDCFQGLNPRSSYEKFKYKDYKSKKKNKGV